MPERNNQNPVQDKPYNPYDAGLWLNEELSPYSVQTHREIDREPAPIALHSHCFYELVYCRTCSGVKFLVGAALYPLQAGDVLLIPPGVSHCAVLPETLQAPFVRDVVWFTQHFLYEEARLYPGGQHSPFSEPRLLHTAGGKWKNLGDLFQICILESEEQLRDWERIVQANTVQILCLLLRVLAEQDDSPLMEEKSPLLSQVMDYIEKNLAQKITLESVAEHFSTSRSTLSQTFRKKTGVSFYAYVIQRRLIAAKTLILQGVPLEQVGKYVGFSEYSAFYRAFKQKYGISPKEYRDSHNTAG